MYGVATKEGFKPFPMLLQTELASGVKTVRNIISKTEPGKEALQTGTDYHLSIWLMSSDHPDDKLLMKLH